MAGEEQWMPSWIDTDFVQKVLKAADEGPNLTVTSYDIEMVTPTGDSYASDMFHLTAKLQNSQERHIILKCHPQEGLREILMINMDTFNKEVWMFTETLPAMNRLLQQAIPDEYQPLGAKCYYHGNDPVKFLALEDLRTSGFIMARRQQGLDLTHCSLAMKKLAYFHAASVALHEQNSTTLLYYDQSAYREQSRSLVDAFLINALRMLAKEVIKWPGYEKYARKLEDMEEVFFDRLKQLCERKENEFNVLMHGDFKTSNMLFRYSGNIPQDVRFVDFQLSHYTSPAVDLQFFFYTSPTDEVRVAHMDSLILEYHATLSNTLKNLKCSRGISFPQLKKTFQDYAFYGLFATVAILPIVLLTPEDEFDFEKSLSVSKNAEENRSVFGNEAYAKIMKRLLPIFEEKGVL